MRSLDSLLRDKSMPKTAIAAAKRIDTGGAVSHCLRAQICSLFYDFGVKARKLKLLKPLPAYIRSLIRRLYLTRVSVFRRLAEHRPEQTSQNRYLRSTCSPVYASKAKRGSWCTKRTHCPMCWARSRVSDVYYQWAAMTHYTPGKGWYAGYTDGRICRGLRRVVVKNHKYDPQEFVALMRAEFEAAKKVCELTASSSILAVAYPLQNSSQDWVIEIRLLVHLEHWKEQLPPKLKPYLINPNGTRFQKSTVPVTNFARVDIVELVAWFMRYPWSLLHLESPADYALFKAVDEANFRLICRGKIANGRLQKQAQEDQRRWFKPEDRRDAADARNAVDVSVCDRAVVSDGGSFGE